MVHSKEKRWSTLVHIVRVIAMLLEVQRFSASDIGEVERVRVQKGFLLDLKEALESPDPTWPLPYGSLATGHAPAPQSSLRSKAPGATQLHLPQPRQSLLFILKDNISKRPFYLFKSLHSTRGFLFI